MAELKRITLDAREMEHPVPLEKSMKIIQSLDEHSYFYMLHRKNPLPLIDFAQEHLLQVISKEDENKQWHILISKNKTIDLRDFLDV